MTVNESNKSTDPERHFDRGSWLTLAIGLVLLVWAVAQVAFTLSVPTDGWASTTTVNEATRTGPFELQFPLSDAPTILQPGDLVVAINGVPLEQNTVPPLPQPWTTGQTIVYTIVRGNATIEVDTTLSDIGLAALLRFLARIPLIYNIASLAWLALGVLIFVLRPGSVAGRYLFIAGAFVAGVSLNDFARASIALYAQPAPAINMVITYTSGWVWAFAVSLILFVLVFPVRLWPLSRYPRAVPLLLFGLAAGAMLFALPHYPALSRTEAQIVVGQIATVGTYFAIAVSVGWSFYRNSRGLTDPVAKAQYLWLTFGLAIGLVGISLLAVLAEMVAPNDPEARDVIFQLAALMSLALPITLAIGILHYRLFDIEVIIRRTTTYAILTGMLLLIYFGSIVVLQRLLSPITGDSDAAVVLSTLLIAALFLPLRRRVQGVIDRRFFRSKYDAEKVLEQFAATVRDETDLDELTAELARVIQETMQPEFVSVWLKPNVERQPSSLVNSE